MSKNRPKFQMDSRKFTAIQALIEHRFSGQTMAEIANEVGISSRQLQRWRTNPAFMEEYNKRLSEWQADLSKIRLAERRERVQALQKMFDATPDSYVARVIENHAPICDEDGDILKDEDGNPVQRLVVYRNNVVAKARLLDQIAEEVGDKARRAELGPTPAEEAMEFARLVQQAVLEMEEMDGARRDLQPPGGTPTWNIPQNKGVEQYEHGRITGV